MKQLLRFAAALCILMAHIGAFAQSACSEGQLPYEVQGHAAATPQAACAMWATQEGFGGYDWEAPSSCTVDGYTDTVVKVCEPAAPESTTVLCNGTCTVMLKPAMEEVDQERLADLSALWTLFFGVSIVIVCLRKLAKIFEGSPHEG